MNNLKINFNFDEKTSKFKLFHDLNENFKTIVCFDDISTTRSEIFIQTLIHEKSFFVMKFNKFQFQKNQNQKKQNKKRIKNESQRERNDRIIESNFENNSSSKKRSNENQQKQINFQFFRRDKSNDNKNERRKKNEKFCYNCEKSKHLTKNCFDFKKKNKSK